MKMIVINSTGPMGSSVVAAMVDKFGYLNIPLRDLGIHEYLVGKRSNNLDRVRNKFIENFKAMSKEVIVGGVNIPDRDSRSARRIIDYELINERVQVLCNRQYHSISELYGDLRKIFADAIKYKRSNHTAGKHVELTTDFHKYPVELLYNEYQQEFDTVVFIHMHRDFMGWIESLASQRFASPKKRFTFVLRWEYKRFMAYEKEINKCDGLHLDFDSLFSPNTKQVVQQLSNHIFEPAPEIIWENEMYDLFGSLLDYEKTFTKADTPGSHLSVVTRWMIKYVIRKGKVTRFDDIIIYVFYLVDMLRSILGKQVKLSR